MNIKRLLLLCPPLKNGGAETYIKTEVVEIRKLGYEAIIYTTGSCNKELFSRISGVEVIEGHFDTNVPESFLQNLNELKQVYERKRYDLIHAHDHHSLLLASCVAALYKAPLLVTFHSTNFFLEKREPLELFFLQQIISSVANQALLLSEEMEKNSSLLFPNLKKVIFRNPIPIYKTQCPRISDIETITNILIVSRLDQDKEISVYNAIQTVNYLFPQAKITVLGDGSQKAKLEESSKLLNKKNRIAFLGYKTNTFDFYNEADLVIGMGRVLLESISLGKISVLSGYQGIVGVVNPSNYSFFKNYNFSGRGSTPLPGPLKLKDEIETLSLEERIELRTKVMEEFDSSKAWSNKIKEIETFSHEESFDGLLSVIPAAVQLAYKTGEHNIFTSTQFSSVVASVIFSNNLYRASLAQSFIYFENRSKEEQISRLEAIQYYLKRGLSQKDDECVKLKEQLQYHSELIEEKDKLITSQEGSICQLRQELQIASRSSFVILLEKIKRMLSAKFKK